MIPFIPMAAELQIVWRLVWRGANSEGGFVPCLWRLETPYKGVVDGSSEDGFVKFGGVRGVGVVFGNGCAGAWEPM